MNTIKIGWLSDIHFKEEYITDGQLKKQVTHLFKAAGKLFKEKKVTHILISGDVAWRGKKDEYLAFSSVLDKLPKDIPVLMVPGNHDVNWSGQWMATFGKELQKLYDINAQEISGKSKEDFERVFEYYQILQDKVKEKNGKTFAPKGMKPTLNHFVFDQKHNVLFLLFNSAWRSIGGKTVDTAFEKFYDELIKTANPVERLGRMLDGELKQEGNQTYFIHEMDWPAIEKIRKQSNPWVVSIAHHPPSWLDWNETNSTTGIYTISYLMETSDLLLTGHLHAPIIQTSVLENECIHMAGCCLIDHGIPLANGNFNENFGHSKLGIVEMGAKSATPITYKIEATHPDGSDVAWIPVKGKKVKIQEKVDGEMVEKWVDPLPKRFAWPEKARGGDSPIQGVADPYLPTIETFLEVLLDSRGIDLRDVCDSDDELLNQSSKLFVDKWYKAIRYEGKQKEDYLFTINANLNVASEATWKTQFAKKSWEELKQKLAGYTKPDAEKASGKRTAKKPLPVVAFYDCLSTPSKLQRLARPELEHHFSKQIDEKTLCFHGFKAHFFEHFPNWTSHLELSVIQDSLFFPTVREKI